MLRYFARTAAWLVAALLVAAPAAAQVVQGFQIGGGGFMPAGYDARPSNDVLVTDLNTQTFDIGHFNGAQVFGEYNVDLGKHLEVGAGLGYYQRTTPSVISGFVNTDGSDIAQNLRLRIIPISAVVRFMPFGKPGHVQPYVGAGVAALRWRYSEFGEFLDNTNTNIFNAAFVGTGTSPAGILLGGVRLPMNGDVFGVMAEIRYTWGTGNLSTNDFLSNKIDLSGTSVNFSFQVRY
ncbi:MAG TPA: outer membrane beta-barrel protein [Vicinamibacterales bacterium]